MRHFPVPKAAVNTFVSQLPILENLQIIFLTLSSEYSMMDFTKSDAIYMFEALDRIVSYWSDFLDIPGDPVIADGILRRSKTPVPWAIQPPGATFVTSGLNVRVVREMQAYLAKKRKDDDEVLL